MITRGVDPQVCCYYRSSRLKQYFKEHRALRTELVISDTRDFGIGRRVNCRQLEGPPGRWRSRQPSPLRRTGIRRRSRSRRGHLRPGDLSVGHPDGLHAPGTAVRGPTGDGGHVRRSSASPTCWPGSTTSQLTDPGLRPCSTSPTPPAKPPTTCAASNARGSSNGSRTPTATSSPRSADASPSCSPRPTPVLAPGLVRLDPALPPRTRCRAAHSPPPGGTSTTPSNDYIGCQIAA